MTATGQKRFLHSKKIYIFTPIKTRELNKQENEDFQCKRE